MRILSEVKIKAQLCFDKIFAQPLPALEAACGRATRGGARTPPFVNKFFTKQVPKKTKSPQHRQKKAPTAEREQREGCAGCEAVIRRMTDAKAEPGAGRLSPSLATATLPTSCGSPGPCERMKLVERRKQLKQKAA